MGTHGTHCDLEEWLQDLQDALEQRLGPVVRDKISSLGNVEPATFDAVSDELVQEVYRSREMSQFRSSTLLADGDKSAGLGLCEDKDSMPRARTAASANASPRNDKLPESPSASGSDRRGRSANRSSTQRMQALEVLLKVPINDIVGSANWPQLQQELCESLRDDNWSVFVQVLKVLARLSSSVAHSPVREGLLSLLEGLTLFYLTRHLHQQLPSALHGIQLENAVHGRIILISQCILQVMNQVPGKWIRYGEKRTQEIVDNFVDLLSMHTHHHRALTTDHSKDVLYPFHIFSILDPEAKWCVNVMHASFGRSILLKCVMKSTSLMRFIVEEVIIWLMSQMKLSEGVTAIFESGKNGNINGNLINLSVFIHCISLLQLLIDSDRGYLMFPVLTSIQEEPVSIYSLLLKTLAYLNKVSNESKVNCSDKISKTLENVCASLILSRGTRILHGSSMELINLLLEAPNRTENISLHDHNINILCKISESPVALRWMLGRSMRRARDGMPRALSDLRISLSSASSSGRESVLTNRTACIARRIAKATSNTIQDRNRFTASESSSPIRQLLSLCERLFSSPEGFLLLESCEGQLVSLTGFLFIHIRNMMYNSDLELRSIQLSLESFLMGVALTPMGFFAVSGVEGLVECLVAAHVENPDSGRCEEPRFLHLMQLSSTIPEIRLRTYRKMMMKNALSKLWTAHDTGSDWIWQEAKHHFMMTALSICPSPSAVAEMLDDQDEDNDSESTMVEEIEPLSLRELLARGLQSTHEPSHYQEISLHLLHILAHNLDIGFVLQKELELKDCIQNILSDIKTKESSDELSVQPSPRRKDKSFSIIDESAYSCNHILNILNQLRDVSSCDLLAMSRSPRSPRVHAHTSRPRIQPELQRFLQDTRLGLHDNMWVSHARRAHRASCFSELKVPMLLDLLDQVLQSHPLAVPSDISLRWPSIVESPVYPLQLTQAVDIFVRFGCHIKALNVNMAYQYSEQLLILLYQTRIFLGNDNTDFMFDWFTSSVFLMCAGNLDRSRSVLQRVAMLPAAPFIWPCLSQNTVHLRASISQQLQCLFADYVPKAYNFFIEAGVPCWLITERLTSQAFLPSIPLSQLPHIIAFTALHSWEYNLYLKTAIIAHLQPTLIKMSLKRCILSLLAVSGMDNFIVGDYFPFMDKLAKLNRPHLVKDRIATATL